MSIQAIIDTLYHDVRNSITYDLTLSLYPAFEGDDDAWDFIADRFEDLQVYCGSVMSHVMCNDDVNVLLTDHIKSGASIGDFYLVDESSYHSIAPESVVNFNTLIKEEWLTRAVPYVIALMKEECGGTPD